MSAIFMYSDEAKRWCKNSYSTSQTEVRAFQDPVAIFMAEPPEAVPV